MQTYLMHSVCKFFEKDVFNDRLNITRVKLLSLRQSGSELPADRPAYEKVILPDVDSFGRGTSSCPLAAERRRLRPSVRESGRHRCIIYFGAMPCRHLQTWTQSLYWVRSETSSQCSSPCLRYHDVYAIRPEPRILIESNIFWTQVFGCRPPVIRQGTVCQGLVLIGRSQLVVFIFLYYYSTTKASILNTKD